MKNIFLAVALFMMLCCVSGCAPRYVEVRGEFFEMITEKEEARLVTQARAALKTLSKKISQADMKVIDNTEPEKRFIYSDHRYGRAVIRWHFPEYEAGVEYDGQFMSEHMGATVYTMKKQAEKKDHTRPFLKHRPSVRSGR